MRPTRLVAGAALTAALALVALPGLAGSRSPSAPRVIDPAAFQPISIPANAATRPFPVAPLDPTLASDAGVDADTAFVTPGSEPERIVGRPTVRQPASAAGSGEVRRGC